MPSNEWGLLPDAQETALHTLPTRFYPVEKRPFDRLRAVFVSPENVKSFCTTRDSSAVKSPDEHPERASEFREFVYCEFATWEATLAHAHLKLLTNERERERYADQKIKIIETAQAIRESTIVHHTQLEEAQKTMALRREYDELANNITKHKMLKSRDEQHIQIEKLNKEIEELSNEYKSYATTWDERREQFDRIVDEGETLLRLVRDENEEAARREGLEEGGDNSAVASPGKDESRVQSPLPDGSTPGKLDIVAALQNGVVSSMKDMKHLAVPSGTLRAVGSPSVKGDDVEMGEVEPEVDIEAEATPAAASDSIEEGEAEEDEPAAGMDEN
ncbi:hypothetical protein K402DRAFT_359312 [Aulographum hederae CBS 113979]|uniref:Uncharacterized protein n=1 Tax=Aulographum hederae CBS 113979 TaxID=1176131 RepID=A0A6G1GTT8_9PEZI|nr:hypothetical protein K402DRAFT_359312 [Aulographum hederae CBS 113979]